MRKAKKKETKAEEPKKLKCELVFSAYAWCKLEYFAKKSRNEIGLLGISHKENPLYVSELYCPHQEVSSTRTEPTEEGLQDYYNKMIEKGLPPSQFMRIWVHSHPGMKAVPSRTDVDTFDEIFGECDWSIMFIWSEFGPSCRMQVCAGQGIRLEKEIPFSVDWEMAYSHLHEEWDKIYDENTQAKYSGRNNAISNERYYEVYSPHLWGFECSVCGKHTPDNKLEMCECCGGWVCPDCLTNGEFGQFCHECLGIRNHPGEKFMCPVCKDFCDPDQALVCCGCERMVCGNCACEETPGFHTCLNCIGMYDEEKEKEEQDESV